MVRATDPCLVMMSRQGFDQQGPGVDSVIITAAMLWRAVAQAAQRVLGGVWPPHDLWETGGHRVVAARSLKD